MESLINAYDMAQHSERGNGWCRYCGAYLGVSVEGEATVCVWDTVDTDTEKCFDTDELSVHQFMTAVEEWVHDSVVTQTSP